MQLHSHNQEFNRKKPQTSPTFSCFKAFHPALTRMTLLSLALPPRSLSLAELPTQTCASHASSFGTNPASLAAGAQSFSCHHPFCRRATSWLEAASGVLGLTRCEEVAQRQMFSPQCLFFISRRFSVLMTAVTVRNHKSWCPCPR